MRGYPEVHQRGSISFENVQHFGIDHIDHSIITGDFGIQIAGDGRIWICINGIAFLRFSPHTNDKIPKGGE